MLQLELYNENEAMSEVNLGQLITTPQNRDAIHVAVAPVIAAESMEPGQHVQLNNEGKGCSGKEPIGIVDPYLKQDVMPGDQFWLFLYPKTVTNLRHNWSHPAFQDKKPRSNKEEAEDWLREFALKYAATFDDMVSGASEVGGGFSTEGITVQGWSELDDGGAEFWKQLEIYTGKKFSKRHREDTYISCSC